MKEKLKGKEEEEKKPHQNVAPKSLKGPLCLCLYCVYGEGLLQRGQTTKERKNINTFLKKKYL
jgi:hypothetical protein